MSTYYLQSQNTNEIIKRFDLFDKEAIRTAIIDHLKKNSTDTVEYYKESKDKRFVGNDLLDFYEVNPKSKEVSKCILKGAKTYFRSIED